MHLGALKVQDDDAVIGCDEYVALVQIAVHDACPVDHGQSLSQVLVQCLVRACIPVPSLALQHTCLWQCQKIGDLSTRPCLFTFRPDPP